MRPSCRAVATSAPAAPGGLERAQVVVVAHATAGVDRDSRQGRGELGHRVKRRSGAAADAREVDHQHLAHAQRWSPAARRRPASRPASSGRGEISRPSRRSTLSTRGGPWAAIDRAGPERLGADDVARGAGASQRVGPLAGRGAGVDPDLRHRRERREHRHVRRRAGDRVEVGDVQAAACGGAHSARATGTGSHPSTSGLRSGAYSARCPRRACTTTPPLRSRTGTIRIVRVSCPHSRAHHPVIGLDVGGANTKAAVVGDDGQVADRAPSRSRCGATRSGWPTRSPRSSGARARSRAGRADHDRRARRRVREQARGRAARARRRRAGAARTPAARIHDGGELVGLEQARAAPLACAAANWVATAMLVARSLPDAILLDCGGTTTDVIPIVGRHGRRPGTDRRRAAARRRARLHGRAADQRRRGALARADRRQAVPGVLRAVRDRRRRAPAARQPAPRAVHVHVPRRSRHVAWPRCAPGWRASSAPTPSSSPTATSRRSPPRSRRRRSPRSPPRSRASPSACRPAPRWSPSASAHSSPARRPSAAGWRFIGDVRLAARRSGRRGRRRGRAVGARP